jgi:hypothetical protein
MSAPEANPTTNWSEKTVSLMAQLRLDFVQSVAAAKEAGDSGIAQELENNINLIDQFR